MPQESRPFNNRNLFSNHYLENLIQSNPEWSEEDHIEAFNAIKKQYNGLSIFFEDIKESDFNLICVPTPVTRHKEPDLNPVRSAAGIVGMNLKKGAIVVLESRVYQGAKEEIVVPILEQESGMKCGRDLNA